MTGFLTWETPLKGIRPISTDQTLGSSIID